MKKIGIIVNSFDEGIRVLGELEKISSVSFYVLLIKKPHESALKFFARLVATFILRGHRFKKINLLGRRLVAFFPQPLSHPQSVAALESLSLDVGLHRSENIYKKSVIHLFKEGILNFHIALLPQYRGRSVLEWTLLNEDQVGATVFFIDEGMDTGTPIVLRKNISRTRLKSVQQGKKFLFSLAGSVYAEAIIELLKRKPDQENDRSLGERYYVMSNLFRRVADQILRDPTVSDASAIK